jgi:DNA-binding transcriptional LysR family regulator
VRNLASETRAVLGPAAGKFDLAALDRTFTLRANDGFVEAFAPRLIVAAASRAPAVRLHFAPKPDKDVGPLREGLIDVEIGVLGESAPEVRVQALFRDRFVGVVRKGHPLLASRQITAKRYAACGHVVVSRRGRATGPVDDALHAIGLRRTVVAVVSGFAAAVAIARASDLIALVPLSFTKGSGKSPDEAFTSAMRVFPLPVRTEPITVSQMWHPRMDADPAHRWLRGLVRTACRVS